MVLGWLAVLLLGRMPVDTAALVGSTPDLGGGQTGVSYTLPATLSWSAVLLGVGAAVGGGGGASFWAARRIARLKPAEALRR